MFDYVLEAQSAQCALWGWISRRGLAVLMGVIGLVTLSSAADSASTCVSNKLGTEMSAAVPIPGGHAGSWNVFARFRVPESGIEFGWTFGSETRGCVERGRSVVPQGQDTVRGYLMADAPWKSFDPKTEIVLIAEIGGCADGQYQRIAMPPDETWAWVGCGSSPRDAFNAAKRICGVKTGCDCKVIGGEDNVQHAPRISPGGGPGQAWAAACAAVQPPR